jgi:hypothetical protein
MMKSPSHLLLLVLILSAAPSLRAAETAAQAPVTTSAYDFLKAACPDLPKPGCGYRETGQTTGISFATSYAQLIKFSPDLATRELIFQEITDYLDTTPTVSTNGSGVTRNSDTGLVLAEHHQFTHDERVYIFTLVYTENDAVIQLTAAPLPKKETHSFEIAPQGR